MTGFRIPPFKRVPVLKAELCNGCHLCVAACKPGCLDPAAGSVRLARLDSCRSEGHCETVCDRGAIRLEWLPFEGDRGVGSWSGD